MNLQVLCAVESGQLVSRGDTLKIKDKLMLNDACIQRGCRRTSVLAQLNARDETSAARDQLIGAMVRTGEPSQQQTKRHYTFENCKDIAACHRSSCHATRTGLTVLCRQTRRNRWARRPAGKCSFSESRRYKAVAACSSAGVFGRCIIECQCVRAEIRVDQFVCHGRPCSDSSICPLIRRRARARRRHLLHAVAVKP